MPCLPHGRASCLATDSLAGLATAGSPALGISLRRHNFVQAQCAGNSGGGDTSGAAMLACATERGPFPATKPTGGGHATLPPNPKWVLHVPRLRAWLGHTWGAATSHSRGKGKDTGEGNGKSDPGNAPGKGTGAGEGDQRGGDGKGGAMPLMTDVIIVNQHHAYEATACGVCMRKARKHGELAHWYNTASARPPTNPHVASPASCQHLHPVSSGAIPRCAPHRPGWAHAHAPCPRVACACMVRVGAKSPCLPRAVCAGASALAFARGTRS